MYVRAGVNEKKQSTIGPNTSGDRFSLKWGGMIIGIIFKGGLACKSGKSDSTAVEYIFRDFT